MKSIPKTGTCQLMGPVSIFIQSLMGILVIIVLLIKRQYEHPRRKLIVWGYDTGKQIGGSLSIHFINLGLSVIKRGGDAIFGFLIGVENYHVVDNESTDDECDWYFLNLLMDTTFGIPILWVTLRILESMLRYFNVRDIESGNYNSSEDSNSEKKPSFGSFLKQLMVFILGLIIMKFFVFLILNFCEDFAYWFANSILGWADKWPNFQIFLVMFVSPVLLNCFQYYCVDNIIKLHSINYKNLNNFERDTSFSDEEDNSLTSNDGDNAFTKFRRNRRTSENSSTYGSIN